MLAPRTERQLHLAFIIGLLFKTLHAAFEVAAGVFFLLVNKIVLSFIVWLATIGEIGEDPNDFFVRYAVNATSSLSPEGQHFIALYLLSHGAVKLIAIILLWRQKIWAYPVSILIFMGFIIYQMHRYFFTHSAWLLVFTAFDVVIILLTIHEYRRKVHMMRV